MILDGKGAEVMLGVYWTLLTAEELRTTKGFGPGHKIRRGEVVMDTGLDENPAFTPAEMQEIARAAKMQMAKCMRARKQKRGPRR